MNNTVRWLWRVAGKKKGYILGLTAVQGAASLSGVVYALLFRAVVDSAVGRDADTFWRSVALLVGLVLLEQAIFAVSRWLYELARSDLENTFKQRLLDNILRRDYASVSATHTAEWLNRLTSDTGVVASGAVEILPEMTGTVVRMISALIMIIALDQWFAFVYLPGGVLVVVLTCAFRSVLKRMHKNIQESDGRLRVFLQERISSLMVVKSFTAENETSAGAAAAMAEHKAARLRRNRFSNIANTGFGTAMEGMYLIGVVYCAYGMMTGSVTYGTLAAIMQLIGQVEGPFASISGYLPRWYAMTASAERLMEVEQFAEDPAPLPAADIRKLYGQMESLSLRDASFTYKTEEAPVVLSHVSLTIRRGEYVAFTGHSGCGKSTALKLLMGMYPLNSGERVIAFAGREEPLTAAHRRLFAYVPQGNALMNGTIRDVVCFAEEKDQERLKRALRIACADEFVEDVNAELGESGSGLSEGQMQRLGIARAIYADAPILLLDESTSALDEDTERRLLENLRAMTDKTVVIVTHRKAALSICDRVLGFTENGVREA